MFVRKLKSIFHFIPTFHHSLPLKFCADIDLICLQEFKTYLDMDSPRDVPHIIDYFVVVFFLHLWQEISIYQTK